MHEGAVPADFLERVALHVPPEVRVDPENAILLHVEVLVEALHQLVNVSVRVRPHDAVEVGAAVGEEDVAEKRCGPQVEGLGEHECGREDAVDAALRSLRDAGPRSACVVLPHRGHPTAPLHLHLADALAGLRLDVGGLVADGVLHLRVLGGAPRVAAAAHDELATCEGVDQAQAGGLRALADLLVPLHAALAADGAEGETAAAAGSMADGRVHVAHAREAGEEAKVAVADALQGTLRRTEAAAALASANRK